MHTLTPRPKTFVVFAATLLFVALATPTWLTARVEQEQPKDQTNYFVKNLDTLEGISALAISCAMGDHIADKRRPDDPPIDPPICNVRYGCSYHFRSCHFCGGGCYKGFFFVCWDLQYNRACIWCSGRPSDGTNVPSDPGSTP